MPHEFVSYLVWAFIVEGFPSVSGYPSYSGCLTLHEADTGCLTNSLKYLDDANYSEADEAFSTSAP